MTAVSHFFTLIIRLWMLGVGSGTLALVSLIFTVVLCNVSFDAYKLKNDFIEIWSG
ncbi:MAG: hypothetical protein QXJ86_01545 [Nitrososphaerales archaeon]